MKKEYGLTLIELMVSMLILTIILSAGVPSLKSFLDNKQLSVVGPIFEKTLRLARTEARKGNQNIRISPIGDGKDWSNGWLIQRVIDAENNVVELIRRFEALPGNPSFTSEQFSQDNPIELRSTSGQAESIGELELTLNGCPDNVKFTYRLLLSGHVTRSTGTCS
ncbi:hypothetical protein NBRC116188_26680 [Oceaniserpentilla sp. 4NH20-0058]|uniref:GspH/FimT family pseudopilin n=1 Tax=Oceaniserpentilla sp. 4NH20-0058 TaxID=3127660 RepID=UPI003104519A